MSAIEPANPVYSTSIFRYDKEQRAYYGEASDMKASMPPSRFDLQSAQTSKIITFSRAKTLYTGNGEDREVAGWEYNDADKKFRVIVYND